MSIVVIRLEVEKRINAIDVSTVTQEVERFVNALAPCIIRHLEAEIRPHTRMKVEI